MSALRWADLTIGGSGPDANLTIVAGIDRTIPCGAIGVFLTRFWWTIWGVYEPFPDPLWLLARSLLRPPCRLCRLCVGFAGCPFCPRIVPIGHFGCGCPQCPHFVPIRGEDV